MTPSAPVAEDAGMAPAVDQGQQPEDAALAQEQMMARLDALGESLAKTRADAIAARQASGIEDEWIEDEEFYQGIDEANRGEMRSTWRRKVPGQAEVKSEAPTRSTVFPNITGPYCDAAAARIADMLLPTDDRGWAIKPTPVPELIGISEGRYPKPMLQAAANAFPAQPNMARKQLQDATQQALDVMEAAKEKADRAQTRIEDWHIECQFHSHVRLVIEDAGRIGVGVLKGPIPVKKARVVYQNGALAKVDEINPESKWLDPWNFYPDGACGENIHNGSYTWERDFLTKRQLRDLKGTPGYIDEQIDLCLQEGAHKAEAQFKPTPDGNLQDQQQQKDRDRYEIWYYHGTAEREDLEAAGCDCSDMPDAHVPAMMTMVNNRVIRAALNPLDTGDFPYDVMVWRRRSGHWAGIGIARQIRTPQRMVTAATRNLMDNAGLAGGVMLVFREGVVYPADGKNTITPRKIWYIKADAEEMVDASKAIGQIKVDMLVDELLKIIELGLKLAEDVTGLPMLMQGQMGKAPDTVGGMQLLNNNASSVLRRLARLFDDRVTEPHVRRYYYWLLQYGEDSEKGDFSIDARGSSALVERDIQNQELGQMGKLVLDPRFGLDPKRWAQEYLRSRHFDPKRFEFDDQEWQKIVENLAQHGGDQRLAVEQLRSQTLEKLKQLEQAFEASENDKDRQLKIAIAVLEERAADASLSADEQQTFAMVKKDLATTAMKLKTQRDLSRDNQLLELHKHAHPAPPVMTPPTEPAGRAQPGASFQQ